MEHVLFRKIGIASFPLASLSSIFAEFGIEFAVVLRQSIYALHANVDVVRSTESGGSCSEIVRFVYVKSTYRVFEGNANSIPNVANTEKVILKEMGQNLLS